MAKRYARLNWQNKPSVATPINATNLNKMDKGIDDCDNAIEEIYAKRVNNVVTTNTDTFLAGPVGKLLQDQITTINNNLAGKILFTQGVISANTNFNEVGNEICRGWLADYSGLVNAPADITSYNGYILLLESCVIDTSYKKQTLYIYTSTGVLSKIYVRCGYDISWGQWRNVSFS